MFRPHTSCTKVKLIFGVVTTSGSVSTFYLIIFWTVLTSLLKNFEEKAAIRKLEQNTICAKNTSSIHLYISVPIYIILCIDFIYLIFNGYIIFSEHACEKCCKSSPCEKPMLFINMSPVEHFQLSRTAQQVTLSLTQSLTESGLY